MGAPDPATRRQRLPGGQVTREGMVSPPIGMMESRFHDDKERTRMQFRRKKTFIEKGMEYAEQALAATESAIADAREKSGPALSDARDTAVERAHEAREKAGPLLADAKSRAVEAREKAGPLLVEARERAGEQAVVGREVAAAKVAKLKGEEPEPKGGGWFKKLLLVGGLAALGAVVASKLRGQQESNWQSSYVPTPPAEPTGAPVTPAAPASGAGDSGASDDQGGADPAESLSDTVDEPHRVTDPDHPVESVDVKPKTGDPLTDPLPPEQRP